MKSKSSYSMPPSQRAQAGSTLIEVLVGALILSIGIMALVSAQGSSVQMAKMAQQRGEASRLAQDYADRVRANASNIALPIYAPLVAPAAYNGNVAAQNIPVNCIGAANCTGIQVAQLDVAEMQERARLLLPNGAFFVNSEALGPPPQPRTVLNVWVIWQTASAKSDDTGTLAGVGCPPGAVSAGTKNVQCLLTRVML